MFHNNRVQYSSVITDAPTIVTDDARPDPLIMNEIDDADEVEDGSVPSIIPSERNWSECLCNLV